MFDTDKKELIIARVPYDISKTQEKMSQFIKIEDSCLPS